MFIYTRRKYDKEYLCICGYLHRFVVRLVTASDLDGMNGDVGKTTAARIIRTTGTSLTVREEEQEEEEEKRRGKS